MASAVGLGELQASVRSGKAGGGRAATAAPAGMRVKKGHLKVKPADAAGPSSGSKRKICEAMCNSVLGETKEPVDPTQYIAWEYPNGAGSIRRSFSPL